VHRAISLATERRHEYATVEHLLVSLTEDQDAASVILGCHVDMDQLRRDLTDHIDSKLEHLVTAVPGTAKPTSTFQHVVQRAILHISKLGRDEITGANVLVALFTEVESHAVHFLRKQGMNRIDAENYIANSRGKPDGGQSG
jgi:ATP-dependent Clp protease ATP-binding subunit ClpA